MANTYSSLNLSGVGGGISTELVSIGTIPSRVQKETWTFPSGATATQADWILMNFNNLYSLSLFLAIDGNATYPTSGQFFSGSPPSYNPDLTQVDILSTDTAVQVAAKFIAAASAFNLTQLDTCSDPIFVDNLDGTVFVTYQTNGPVLFQSVSYVSDGSGPGSISISITQTGEIQKSALVEVIGATPEARMEISSNLGTSSLALAENGLTYTSPAGLAMRVSPSGVISDLATISAQEYRSPLGQIIITPRLTDDVSPDNARITLTDANSFGATLDLFALSPAASANVYAHTVGANGTSEYRLASDVSGDPFFYAKAEKATKSASWNVTPVIAGLAVFDTQPDPLITAAYQAYNNAGEPEVLSSVGGGTGSGFSALRLIQDKVTLSIGGTTPYDGTEGIALNGAGSVDILGTQVIATQQAAIPDAVGGTTVDTEARAALNDLLAKLRIHGLIDV